MNASARHSTLDDYARFMIAHLAGARGASGLVSSDSFLELHSPVAPNYALGWGVAYSLQTLNVPGLTHDGSTGRWFSLVVLAPSLDTGFVIFTNGGGDRARAAMEALYTQARQRVMEAP